MYVLACERSKATDGNSNVFPSSKSSCSEDILGVDGSSSCRILTVCLGLEGVEVDRKAFFDQALPRAKGSNSGWLVG